VSNIAFVEFSSPKSFFFSVLFSNITKTYIIGEMFRCHRMFL